MNTLRTVDRQIIGLNFKEHGIDDDVLDKYVRVGTPLEITTHLEILEIDDVVKSFAIHSLEAVGRPRI